MAQPTPAEPNQPCDGWACTELWPRIPYCHSPPTPEPMTHSEFLGPQEEQGTVPVFHCLNSPSYTKAGFHHVTQAGLELLSSSDLPAWAFQCARIT
ncbi:hypothetical protein AAY473_017493, partial [Plecturocebus cupreus]